MQKTRVKEIIGTVVSDKMNKTITVRVRQQTVHPIFKKAVRKFKKFKAHDEKNTAKTGDVVRIREIRPLSKDKHWRLTKVVETAEG